VATLGWVLERLIRKHLVRLAQEQPEALQTQQQVFACYSALSIEVLLCQNFLTYSMKMVSFLACMKRKNAPSLRAVL
jgi:hypothetical protein